MFYLLFCLLIQYLTGAFSPQTVTQTGTPLTQAALRGRVQEIAGTSVVGQVSPAVSQVRGQLQTSATTINTALQNVQLAQRITAATTLASGGEHMDKL